MGDKYFDSTQQKTPLDQLAEHYGPNGKEGRKPCPGWTTQVSDGPGSSHPGVEHESGRCGCDDMPDDIEAYRNERAEEMP